MEGRHGQPPHCLVQAERLHRPARLPAHGSLRGPHALGRPGRARGVDQVGVPIGALRAGDGRTGRGQGPRRRGRGPGPSCQAQVLAVPDHYQGRVAILDDGGQAELRAADLKGNERSPQPQAAQGQADELGRVRNVESHPVTGADTEGTEPRSGPGHVLGQLAVGKRTLVVLQGQAVGPPSGVPQHQAQQIGGVRRRRLVPGRPGFVRNGHGRHGSYGPTAGSGAPFPARARSAAPAVAVSHNRAK